MPHNTALENQMLAAISPRQPMTLPSSSPKVRLKTGMPIPSLVSVTLPIRTLSEDTLATWPEGSIVTVPEFVTMEILWGVRLTSFILSSLVAWVVIGFIITALLTHVKKIRCL